MYNWDQTGSASSPNLVDPPDFLAEPVNNEGLSLMFMPPHG